MKQQKLNPTLLKLLEQKKLKDQKNNKFNTTTKQLNSTNVSKGGFGNQKSCGRRGK